MVARWWLGLRWRRLFFLSSCWWLLACLVLLLLAVGLLGVAWLAVGLLGLVSDGDQDGWLIDGGARVACLVLLVLLAVGLLGVAWLAVGLLGVAWCCLVLLGCGWITGADRCRRADRWLACGWLVVLVSQKFLLLLWASSVQACCV